MGGGEGRNIKRAHTCIKRGTNEFTVIPSNSNTFSDWKRTEVIKNDFEKKAIVVLHWTGTCL